MDQVDEHNSEEVQTQAAAPLEQVQQEQSSESDVVTPAHESSKTMVIIAVLAIIVVALSLMYMWGTRVKNETETQQAPVVNPSPIQDNETEVSQPAASDTLESIEADLETTTTTDLDAELGTLEAELDAALQE